MAIARSSHNTVGDLHIRERIQHGNLLGEDIVVVDDWWTVATKDVWDGRVVLVREVLKSFLLRSAILILGQRGMADETRELLKMLESLLDGLLPKLAERKLLIVVPNVLKDGVEMILVEDELHEALRLDGKLARSLILGFSVIVIFSFDTSVVVVVIVVVPLQVSVLALLGLASTFIPSEAGLLLELLVVLL
jgi:hypothetical protein